MESVARGGGEEAENLKTVDTLRNAFDSFARQPCYERNLPLLLCQERFNEASLPESTRGSQQKGH